MPLPGAPRTTPSAGNDAGSDRVRRGRGLLVIVALLAGLAVLAAAGNGPWEMTTTPATDVELPAAELPLDDEREAEQGDPGRLTADINPLPILGVATLVAALLALRVLLRRAVVRGSQPPAAEELAGPGSLGEVEVAVPELPVLRRGAAAARRALAGSGPPGNAIIAAWLELEAAAESSGVPRRPAQTPTEFTRAVLDATAADPSATTELLGLYRRARFATDPRLGTDHVARAQACLERLAASWEGP